MGWIVVALLILVVFTYFLPNPVLYDDDSNSNSEPAHHQERSEGKRM